MIKPISIFIMTLSASFASIFLKKTSASEKFINLLNNINLYIGGILYLIASIANIVALKFLPYSIVVPLGSITYIWTMIISYFLLNEKITKNKIISIFLIIIGATMVSIS